MPKNKLKNTGFRFQDRFKIEITGENHAVANIEGFLPEYCDVFFTSEASNVNLIPGLVVAEPGYKGAFDIVVLQLP